MDKGYKTSEFWITVVVQIVGFLIASGVFAEVSPIGKVLSFAAMALSALGYSAARTGVKKADALANAAKAVKLPLVEAAKNIAEKVSPEKK